MSFCRNFFRLAISNWSITVHKVIFGKTFSWTLITKSNKICSSSKKISVCVLKTNYYFLEQRLVRRFVKKSNLLTFFWIRAAKVSLVLSKMFWAFLVDRLTAWNKIQRKFFKKSFFGLCSQTDTTTSKKHIWAHIMEEKKGKFVFFCFRATGYQQVFSNLSCNCSVRFSGKRISKVFLDSVRIFFHGVLKLDFIRAQIHNGGSFFGKFFLKEVLWFQGKSVLLVLAEVKWTSHVNRLLRKKWCAIFKN